MNKWTIPILIFASLGIHVLVTILSHTIFEGSIWQNQEVHVTIESAGGIIALFVAYFLLAQERVNAGTSFNKQISAALIGMGLIDICHGIVPPGKLFVWFHSCATAIGGLFFASTFIPKSSSLGTKSVVSLTTSLGSFLVFYSFLYPQNIPDMISPAGQFTMTANLLNLGGGFLLIISGFKLMVTYQKTENKDDLLFCLHCILFGVAALMFQTSMLWDISWWGWHGLRFLAYCAALYFVLSSINDNYNLHSEKQLLSQALNVSSLGVWSTEIETGVVTFDTRMRAIYELNDNEDLDPEMVQQFIVPEDQNILNQIVEQVTADKNAKKFTYRIKAKSGRIKTIAGSIAPQFDSQKKITHYVGVNRDITHIVDSQKEQKKLLEILDNTSDYIAHSNEFGQIVYINRALSELLGHSKRRGKLDHSDAQPNWAIDIVESIGIPQAIKNGSWSGDTAVFNKDGLEIPVSQVIISHKDLKGNHVFFSTVMRDIREKKNLLEKIEAKQIITEKALKTRSAFLANMSHEIRTPLNGILGMTTLLQDEVEDELSAHKLEIIEKSGNLLLSIINDILDLSKIEAGNLKLELTSTDLRDNLEQVIRLVENQPNRNSNEFTVEISNDLPQIILADPNRLQQVLINLLSNAGKFCENGRIELVADKLIQDGQETIRFRVTDTGIGIDEKKLDNLFNSFTQADESSTRKFGGTGLGLAICKSIVTMWEGKISAKSELGVGTTITVDLPLRVAEAPLNTDKQQDISKLENLKGLVVDDNDLNREIACNFLKKINITADIAIDGLEATKMVDKTKYDFILMDCHMPVMDGLEATRNIKAKHGDSSPWIIALTASALAEEQKKCYAAGMDDFLSKPLRAKFLRSSLLKVAENRGIQEEPNNNKKQA